MNILLVPILLVILVYSNALTQFNDSYRVAKANQINYYEKLYKNDVNTAYKLKLEDRQIPISFVYGQIPSERQIEVIKNVIKNDFLVNDDTIGGVVEQNHPSIAIDRLGNFVVVWTDARNGNYDIYYQRYNSLGIAQGVNTKVNDDAGMTRQFAPKIAMDDAGNYVVVWVDERNEIPDIYYQQYNSLGEPQGVNKKVNDDVGTAYQSRHSIAMNGTGDFIVVWEDYRNGNGDIYYQRYNSLGIAQGVNKRINDDAGTATSWFPSVAMNSTGKFVVVWIEFIEDIDSLDVYFQRFDSLGLPQGLKIKVNDDTGTAWQSQPSVVMDEDANFIVVWPDQRNGNWDIYYQRYNSYGLAQGVNTRVNDVAGTANNTAPSIAINGVSNFVVVWEDYRNGNIDIYYQRYDSLGNAQGVNTKVNNDTVTTAKRLPSIAMDDLGNFIVTWVDYGGNLDDNPNIYYQRFNSSGLSHGQKIKVNDDVGTATQLEPSIAMNGDGNFVVVWMDDRNSINNDIYFQRFNSLGVAQGVNTKVNDNLSSSLQDPSVAIDSVGNFVVVWVDNRNDEPDIYYQRYNNLGIPQGVNSRVNNDYYSSNNQEEPSIAMDGNGNFIIVWTDCREYHINGKDIYCHIFLKSGLGPDYNIKISTDEFYPPFYSNSYNPSVAIGRSGNCVVVWLETTGYGYGIDPDIYSIIFNLNSFGRNSFIKRKVNDDTVRAFQHAPSVAMDGDGNFVVVWMDDRNGNYDIYYQRFDSLGNVQGVNTKVNDDTRAALPVTKPSIAMDGTGNFVVVWDDYRYGKNNPDIIGQRYFSNGVANGSNYRIVANGPNSGEKSPVVSANDNRILFAWRDNRRSKDWDIYAKIVGWNWGGVSSGLQDVNIPTGFTLAQNYPNPFNSKTTIEFSLPERSYVELCIYNVLGQKMETILMEEREAGTHRIVWDASKFQSGVYFYRIVAGSFAVVKKLVLLK